MKLKDNLSKMKFVSIEPGDAEFENVVADINRALHNEQITFFTGAGISNPSGLPIADKLCHSILEAMGKSLEITGACSTREKDSIINILKNYRLERLLDSLIGTYLDSGILKFLNVLLNAKENFNHKAIAKFAKSGYINHIITLNFDVLYEQALSNQNFSWLLPLVHNKPIPYANSKFTIIKPHGTLPFAANPDFSYAPHYLSATLQYAGDRPQKENIQAITGKISRKPVLFVSGYSDNDWDISPIIKDIHWDHVYWCLFTSEDKGKFSESIMKWFNSRPNSTTFLVGDVRKILARLLGEEIPFIDKDQRNPDSSIFMKHPLATALASITLIDGTSNELYCKLLPDFERLINKDLDKELYFKWERAMAWYFHSQKRNIRQAINIYSELLKKRPERGKIESYFDEIKDIKSIYYEYISAAKRPHLNFRWPIDLVIAYYYKLLIIRKVRKLKSFESATSWLIKEANKQIAFANYYVVDLYHNWGYYLLPFRNVIIRKIARLVYKSIFKKYQRLEEKYPVMSWEYMYARSIEAALLANPEFRSPIVIEKLESIKEMFETLGRHGHEYYVKTLLAIIEKSVKKYDEIEKIFFSDDTGTSPTAKLRMVLFKNYFFPDSRNISTYKLLREMAKYTDKQK